MKQAKNMVAILAMCPLILTGCATPQVAEVDWAAHAYEYKQRSACRSQCRFSVYDSGVETECYGSCMSERGFFCHRDFRGKCYDTTGTGIAESCVTPPDNFDCTASRPLPEEYRPGGSKWKAHKEYSKCVQENFSVVGSLFETLQESTEGLREKCGRVEDY